MNESKRELLAYLETLSLIITAAFFLLYPLIFLTQTTDAFAIPKQGLLIVFVILSFILLAARMFSLGRIRFRSTPFDQPILALGVVGLVSAVLAVNRFDALIAFAPLLYAILAYFLITNNIRSERSILVVTSALIAGATLVGLNAILSYFKLFLLPWSYTQNQAFSPIGSLLDQGLFLALVLPLAGYIASPILSQLGHKVRRNKHTDMFASQNETAEETSSKIFAFGVAFLVMLAGLLVTVLQLVTTQKPLILPFETGFQTAFAAISQDQGRVLLSFLFGSGWGTYMTDFTRFKAQAYNLNPQLWSFTFFRSSSFVLELLATTGFLGFASFLFLVYRVLRQRVFFIPVVLGIVAAFLLPFSYIVLLTFIIILALFACLRGLTEKKQYADYDFYFVASKDANEGLRYASVLPLLLFIVIGGLLAVISFFSVKFVLSDITFQSALKAASENRAKDTYDLQRSAITQFQWRDSYYRIFSQTNLALANSLALSQPRGSSPSADVQNNILTLIQQSINAGRQAVNISPMTSINWNNLSAVYRSLIGFGDNADRFSVLTNQQAIVLDPNNPQQFINLGGIYYQLGNWDLAQQQFQTAIQLKPDYANAYYNLGHTLENKNDFQGALQMYQNVKTLVAGQPDNLKKINDEIAALQQKIGNQAKANVSGSAENQPGLGVEDKPTAQLPERDPREKIQGPPADKISPTPTPSAKSKATRETKVTGEVTPSPAQ